MKKYFIMKKIVFQVLFFTSTIILAQNNMMYWQQHVNYTMEVDFDVKTFQYKGTQKLAYTNNSPDTLNVVFYHLYFNAFQPNSEMNARLQAVPDPDERMVTNLGTKYNPIYESRISSLKQNEIGYLNVISLKENGENVAYTPEGTILKVTLNSPIKPNQTVIFDMVFEGQLPIHIRRAGRNNEDNVAISMAQWYPKIAEYDFEGWHANSYIAREFHGVWGDFDVKITLDKNYTVGGTGYLQNPQEVGHGYEDPSKKMNLKKGNKLTWHFIAPMVHDFSWAADPNYTHDILKTANGTTLHFLYKNDAKYAKAWKEVQPYTEKALHYFNENIGEYPYKQYSIIQAGDGGMEYAMCTFITGGETLGSIRGLIFHEFAHSWFQHILATNESKHSWMDEGFTTYISTLASNKIMKGLDDDFNENSYASYFYAVKNELDEPLTTHADRFNTNTAFSIGSYTKGSIFLSQLNYIIGTENVKQTIKNYYTHFKFKHPTPNDFKRIAEKVSGIQLDWYLNEWTQTNHTIDYAIAKVNNTTVTLARVGQMPMPIDLTITYTDGSKEDFYIPLRMMLGEKPTSATTLKSWAWGFPTYTFSTSKNIKSVEIDPSKLMADIDRGNNIFNTQP
jgi:hypothetical protein